MLRRPSNNSSIVANPVLVGAVTVLVVVTAVFLAYNANKGLPFVPTRTMEIDLPNAANLVEQNDVREGGTRIGIVDRIRPVRLPNGQIGARVLMKLDQPVPPVPVDSRFTVRPRSALALKYIELDRGDSSRTVEEGGRLGVARTATKVEIDELFNTFDARTRAGQRRNLRGFGDGFAGRGGNINEAFGLFPRFLGLLQPVVANIADPRTNFARLFPELGDAARVVAPLATEFAEGFGVQATTFEAFSRDPDALRNTIAKTPSTLRTGARSFVNQRPFLGDLTKFSKDLERAAIEVTAAASPLTRALNIAGPAQRRSVALNGRLDDTLNALGELVRDPLTVPALGRATELVNTLNPTIRFLGPKITVCNGFNYYWTYNAEHLSEENVSGFAERGASFTPPDEPNSYGSMGAVRPSNGPASHFHGQAGARAIDERGAADCEAVQRGYPRRLNPFGPADQEIAIASRTPGNQGPVFDQFINGKGVGLGPDRLPKGQTGSAEPESGAPLPELTQVPAR